MHGTSPDPDLPDVRTPLRLDAMGLSVPFMEDLLLRRVAKDGRAAMTDLADRLHVSVNIVDALCGPMRDRKLVEFDGMDGRAYRVAITEAGRELAIARSRECRYAGPMPVPLDLYTRVVRAQRPTLHLDRERLSRSFSDLVIAPDLLDFLGPAIHGSGAMFLYGPPGTGKSSIAERIVRAYEDVVLIPHCVEVDGQIVSVFDPTLHVPCPEQPPGLDRRWVACQRPAVVTGGELHGAMLDLQLDRDTGVYLAPLQFKANNGVLVIDDFGRQAMSPEALLNRWIVPLDRQVDYLTLHGRKFEVPFELKVVLSTNLDPSQLGDEAFFRRIHNKIYIGACTDEQFDWILARVARKHGLECDAHAAARLRQEAKARGDGELRAYLPGVVTQLALAITRYENLPPLLTPFLVDRVLDLYFTRVAGPEPDPSAVTQPGTVRRQLEGAVDGHRGTLDEVVGHDPVLSQPAIGGDLTAQPPAL
jgi:Mn-dependent DtxR family transcriptional regulator